MAGTKGKVLRMFGDVRERGKVTLLLLCMAAFLAGTVCSGCSWFKEKPELSAEENYQKGMEEFGDKDYADAIPYFQKILENYPFSVHAVPAELKIAECYFLDEKYVEALVHLQGFEELHPTNEQIPYVIWMKAGSFFEQFSTIDRDVSPLKNARQELEGLQSRFPESPYAQKAGPMLEKVLERLARHDFYVARFYYQDSDFPAALVRFNMILSSYPAKDVKDRAMYYVGKCHYFLRNDQQARETFEDLLRTYPDSRYVPQARRFLKDLEQGRKGIISRYFRLKEHLFKYFGYE